MQNKNEQQSKNNVNEIKRKKTQNTNRIVCLYRLSNMNMGGSGRMRDRISMRKKSSTPDQLESSR